MSSGSGYQSLFGVWSDTSSAMFESFIEANRAAAAAFGMPGAVEESPGYGDDSERGLRAEERIDPAGDLPEWETDLEATGGELGVGDRVRFTKTLTEADVERFAAASGDTNPLHMDDDWAEGTRFDGRIAHGILVSGTISAALARLPGGVIYLSQDLEFRAPVRIGDRVSADVEVVEDLGGGRFRLRTVVERDEDVVIDGEAVVLIEDLPEHER